MYKLILMFVFVRIVWTRSYAPG